MRAILIFLAMVFSLAIGSVAVAQDGPLRLRITDGVIEPMPFAIPAFQAESAAAGQLAGDISRVVAADLTGTGLFREISPDAFISTVSNFASPVQYADWKAINAQALITGAVNADGQGNITVKFRVYDVFSGAELGKGLQFAGTAQGWRRMAHKVADEVYSRITGEGKYFDSRVVFVSETGPKNDRKKRLGIMDYDGANVQYLTDSSAIVLAPRISPDGNQVLYTSYETGFPRIYVLDVGSVQQRVLESQQGTMSFAPRFAPNGQTVVYSLSQGANTDIWAMDIRLSSRSRRGGTQIFIR